MEQHQVPDVPDTLPQFILDVSRPEIARRKALSQRTPMPNPIQPRETREYLTSDVVSTAAAITKKPEPEYPNMPKGSMALIFTLPSDPLLSGQARKYLAPLKVYTCETESSLTKSKNYQVKIDGVDKSLRIPAGSMIFPVGPVSPTRLSGAATVIENLQKIYQKELEALIAPYTGVIAIKGEPALFYPRDIKDIPVTARPFVTCGRAHVVTLYDTKVFEKQSFTIEGAEEPFHVMVKSVTSKMSIPPINSIIYGIERIIPKINALTEKSNDDLKAGLAAYFAQETDEIPTLSGDISNPSFEVAESVTVLADRDLQFTPVPPVPAPFPVREMDPEPEDLEPDGPEIPEPAADDTIPDDPELVLAAPVAPAMDPQWELKLLRMEMEMLKIKHENEMLKLQHENELLKQENEHLKDTAAKDALIATLTAKMESKEVVIHLEAQVVTLKKEKTFLTRQVRDYVDLMDPQDPQLSGLPRPNWPDAGRDAQA